LVPQIAREIKFKILGYLNTEEIALAAANPALQDVAAAILARGGHLPLRPNRGGATSFET